MVKQIKKSIGRFAKADSGQFAIWFGVAAFPVLVATTFVIDFRSVEHDRASIKTALDAAVLTAVSNDRVTMSGKEQLAVEVFSAHYAGKAELVLLATATDGRVQMSAKGKKMASLVRSVGIEAFDISETSIAEMNRENTICVLALAEEGKEKLRFLEGTEFNSPTCSVQSNSRDNDGVLSSSRYTPIAKSFCSAGGAKGAFEPAIRGECRVIDDPYVSKKAPTPGLCMPESLFKSAPDLLQGVASVIGAVSGITSINGHEPGVRINVTGAGRHEHAHCHTDGGQCHSSAHNVEEVHAPTPGLRLQNLVIPVSDVLRLTTDYGLQSLLVTESENYTGSNGTFYPGTYCGGLTVDGTNVTFSSGTYIIKDGPLTFKNGASADAQDVSFVLTGANAVVTVESGSYVDIKAPKTGDMAGLAFFQDRNVTVAADTSAKTNKGKGQTSIVGAPGATGVNLISSGGELNVTGTMYFPTQALDVLGDSVLGARAPATSFIAHQVTFAGETKAAVSVDYVKGGIPPLLPRSDDGARLVK